MKIVGYFTNFVFTMMVLNCCIEKSDSADDGDYSRSRGKGIYLRESPEQRMKEIVEAGHREGDVTVPDTRITQSILREDGTHKENLRTTWTDDMEKNLFKTIYTNYDMMRGKPKWNAVLEEWNSLNRGIKYTKTRIQQHFYPLLRNMLSHNLNIGNIHWDEEHKLDLLRIYYQTMGDGVEGHAERMHGKWKEEHPNVEVSGPNLIKAAKTIFKFRKEVKGKKEQTEPFRSMSSSSHKILGHNNELDLELRLNPAHIGATRRNSADINLNESPSTPSRQRLGHARFRHKE